MSKRKTVLKLSVIFLILLGLYVGVSAKQMDAANQVTGLYYDGPRMDVVRFRELLEVHSNPLEPGEARALKIDNETNLPMSTVLLSTGDVTSWQSRVEQPDGTYSLYFENNTPVKYRLVQEDEIAAMENDVEYFSDPEQLRILLDAYETEARELAAAWNEQNKDTSSLYKKEPLFYSRSPKGSNFKLNAD